MADNVAAPHRIQIQEYGDWLLCPAERLDLHALINANRRWKAALGLSGDPIRIENTSDGNIMLRAEAITGVLRIGNVDIEIAPKFLSAVDGSWQSVLWQILTVVEGGHVDDNPTTADELASGSMPDLLAEMFLRSYARGAARGLPRVYQSEQMSGSILRGSIDTTRIVDWIARPWELHYIADLLTDDTPLARLLRWSAQCLASTVQSPARARALREIAANLAHVGRSPPHLFDARRMSLGIQHQALEAAWLVGLMLLEGVGVHHAAGKHAISGFLWNSDTIYENYIYWLCQQAASFTGNRIEKRQIKFGEVISGTGTKLVTEPEAVSANRVGSHFVPARQ